MKKTIFEEMDGTYTQVGDYFLPDLKPPEEKTKPIGIQGQRHKYYLQKYKKVFYTTLLTSGKLNSYLADIDEQTQDMMFCLVEQISDRESITEELKVENPILWVGRMNEIQARAREIVNAELIYN